MSQTPLKNQAEEITEAVDRDMQTVEAKPVTVQQDVDRKADALANRVMDLKKDVEMRQRHGRRR